MYFSPWRPKAVGEELDRGPVDEGGQEDEHDGRRFEQLPLGV